MSNIDQEKLKAMAAELAKDIKTQSDLSDLSASLLKMTVEAALWRSRPLDEVYPLLYLDGIVIKVRQDKQVVRKTMNQFMILHEERLKPYV